MTPEDLLDPAAWAKWLDATLFRKLASHSPLTTDDRDALRTIIGRPERIAARSTLIVEGAAPTAACVLLEGFACRFKTLSNGRRQIMSFHVAGDAIDLQSALLGRADHGMAALTSVVVARMPNDALRAAAAGRPALQDTLWRETLIDGAVFREWLLNVGQRDAYARLAHLICEVAVRSAAAGLSRGSVFSFPVTQIELAEATGLSAVHVNRTLQRLRRDGYLTMHGDEVRLLDWAGLTRAAGFDPAYLYIRQVPEAA